VDPFSLLNSRHHVVYTRTDHNRSHAQTLSSVKVCIFPASFGLYGAIQMHYYYLVGIRVMKKTTTESHPSLILTGIF